MSDAILNIKVGADVKGAIDGFKQTEAEASKLGQSVQEVGERFQFTNDQVNKGAALLLTQSDAAGEAAAANSKLARATLDASAAMDETAASGSKMGLSLAQSRVAFQDLGRLLTGQSFSLRSISSNFTLLGPAITIAAAAIGFIGKELYDYANQAKTADDITKQLAETVAKGLSDEVGETQVLAATILDSNTSRKQQKDLIDQLIQQHPNYFSNLKDTKDLTETLTDDVNKYVKALEDEATIKAISAGVTELESKKIQNQIDFYSQLDYWQKRANADKADGNTDAEALDVESIRLATTETQKKNAEIQKQIDLYTHLGVVNEQNLAKLGGNPDDTGNTDHDNSLAELQKYIDDSAKIRADAEDKEIIEENDKYNKIFADLTKFHHDTEAATDQHNKNLSDIYQKYTDQNNAAIAKGFADEKAKQLEAEIKGEADLTKQVESYIQKSQDLNTDARTSELNAEQAKYDKLIAEAMLYGRNIEDIQQQHIKNMAAINAKNDAGDEIDNTRANVANFQLKFDTEAQSQSIQKAFNEVKKQIEENLKAGNIDVAYKVSLHMDEATRKQAVADAGKEINGLVEQVGDAAIEGIGTVLGNILAGAKNPMNDVIKSIGTILGDGLEDIGKKLVVAGGIMKTINTAIQNLEIDPEVGVLVGIAAIAAGTLIKAEVSKTAATAFADGGIVTGPTYGLVGEAGPEAIIPLSQMDKVVRSVAGGGNQLRVIGNMRISGSDQLITFSRAQKQQKMV